MVNMRIKKLFFDSPRVQRAMDTSTRRAMSRAGAFVRTRAKSSIRKRKGISKPGNPPSSHTGILKRLIFFGYDPADQNVVIGPVVHGKGEAPRLLEFGGKVTRRDWRTRSRRPRRLVYRKRPFMGPAMTAELPNLPKRWRNSIRGGS